MQETAEESTTLLENVLSRLEVELLEARTLRDQIESEYRERLVPVANRVRALEIAVQHQREALENYSGTRCPATPKADPEKLTDLAFRKLKDAGEPMHYRHLAELLASDGASLTGKDPGTMLINYLRREPTRFCRTAAPGHYALIEWHLPDAKPVSGERKPSPAKKRTARPKNGAKKATPKRKTGRTTK